MTKNKTLLLCVILLLSSIYQITWASNANSGISAGKQSLTFGQRIQCQSAIEKIYWQYRIWPKENLQPKPPFESMILEESMRMKVEDNLKKTNALQNTWHKMITGDMLQAEMNRMAQHTKNPNILKDLWNALNNDPHLVAECLARPILVDRLIRNSFSYDEKFHGNLKQRARAELIKFADVTQMKQMSGAYSENVWTIKGEKVKGQGESQSIKLNEDEWKQLIAKLAQDFSNSLLKSADYKENTNLYFDELPVGNISPLHENENSFYVIALLDKSPNKMRVAKMVWEKDSFEAWWQNNRASYPMNMEEPAYEYHLPAIAFVPCGSDSWIATSTINAPSARIGHTAVWTGTEMIIWGGEGGGNTGGKYNPETDSWTPTATANGPGGMIWHTAVWTGTEMIVWHGSGGRYNPLTNTWAPMSSVNAPCLRSWYSAVWTGTEMIIWGGEYNGLFNTGGKYNPNTDSWIPTSAVNAPSGRRDHTAVWTGTEMIIWGGCDNACSINLISGGRYNPVTNSWIATSTTNVPLGRGGHKAVWTGTDMIVWGGYITDQYVNTGGIYNPGTNSWRPTTTVNAPDGRGVPAVIWTGTEMIVWGGFNYSGVNYLDTGGRYNPYTDSWIPTTMTNVPHFRGYHSVVWTGDEMIIWGGKDNSNYFNTGARYGAGCNEWTATTLINAPSAREDHTAVWTGTEMIIWGGIQAGGPVFNTGSKYSPGTDSWTPLSVNNAPSARRYHSAVWTGTQMIIWGGDNGSTDFITGGRYNPGTDSWTPTTTINAPAARLWNSTVWTGTEMIIWGGGLLNSGGRYNPNTDSWIPTSLVNAPSGRRNHTAVWSGTEMVIWGGCDNACSVNLISGGRYNPATDSWIATATSNVPSGRGGHQAIWTGADMIVWGGYITDQYVNTGGIYNPGTNSWRPTTTVNAPDGRGVHTMIWTGTEMIVWGGFNYSSANYLNTGGKYNPATDSWVPTSMTNVPGIRGYHTGVWTGSEMIIWGGKKTYMDVLNTGGRYCVSTPRIVMLVSHRPAVDDSGSRTANGIIEPSETVNLIGSLTNMGTSIATSVTGTLTTADPITINNPDASYPNINSGATASCSTCYSVTAPASNRPATHWDFITTESPICSECTPASYNFTYHVGNSFGDVPPSHQYYSYIETLFHNGIVSGCTSNALCALYCPSSPVNKEQIAKYVCDSMNVVSSGACLTSSCKGIFFDVPASNSFCPYIEALFAKGVVSACPSFMLRYCPHKDLSREEMAKITCMAMSVVHPGSCNPTACAGIFKDVPATNPFCGYIEALYHANIVSGCEPSLFCPEADVSRGGMAEFLVNAFGFTL